MQNNFEEALNEIINDTLNEIFSETATKVIYQHLEKNYKLKPEEVATNIDTFKEGLERFLSSGAMTVENVIIKRLYMRFGQKFQEKQGHTFTDYVKELKHQAKSP